MYIPPVISLQIEMSLAVFSGDCRPLYLHVLHVQLAVHDHELHQNLQTPDLFTYRKPSEFTCPTLSSFISLLSCSHRRLKGKWWLVYLVSPLRGERRLSPVTDLEVAQQTPARRMEAGVGEVSLVPPVPRDQHHLPGKMSTVSTDIPTVNLPSWILQVTPLCLSPAGPSAPSWSSWSSARHTWRWEPGGVSVCPPAGKCMYYSSFCKILLLIRNTFHS